MLLLAVATLSAGSGFNGPSLSSMVSKLTHPDDQGGMLGLASSLSSLGRVVGPAWGGWLFDHYGIGAPYVSSALILLVSVGVAVTQLRRV
jgi:predicted MFS family arabinose efflux permease